MAVRNVPDPMAVRNVPDETLAAPAAPARPCHVGARPGLVDEDEPAWIERCGARLRYLPPYSPDLNPIELAFAKLKALLRKAAERSIEALWRRIGRSLDQFTPQECANYFGHPGYAPM